MVHLISKHVLGNVLSVSVKLQKKLTSNSMRYLLQNAWKLALHLCVTASSRIISHSFDTKMILLHQRVSRKLSA